MLMKGMANPIRMPKVLDALFAKRVKDDGHPDIGIEPVAALGKGACLEVGYLEHL